MQKVYTIPDLPLQYDLETKEVLRQVNCANRKLAELKGVAQTIPNTKIGHIEANMQVSRQTASRYLEKLVELGLLQKEKMWKENHYINTRLMNLFIDFGKYDMPRKSDNKIESVHVKEKGVI